MSIIEYKISGFKNQSVRDLAWAISTPPIISSSFYPCYRPASSWYQDIFKETLSWFSELDQDCSSLDILLAEQKDRRLGKYFETLWFYWLSHHPRYEVLAHNLQIIIDGETLGEIDFILFDKKQKKIVHWEVAVKFYLGINDTRQMSNWHGPNLRDRLDIKVKHLLNRQSLISQDCRVADWLKKQGLAIDQCAVILKGRLYYHWHQFEEKKLGDQKQRHKKIKNISKVNAEDAENLVSALKSPEQSSVDHLRSQWFRQSEFDEVFSDQQRFLPLIKNGWLQGLPTTAVDELMSKQALFKTLSNKELRLPMHLQLYTGDRTGDRIFLVDENWSKSG